MSNQYEAKEQADLMDWVAYAGGRFPALRLLYHVPNGGRRNPREAAHLKRQGVKKGVPDLCLPVARGGFHGLYIELKYGRNKPTEDQAAWIAALREQGYAAEVCYGWQQAKELLEKYLSGKFERKERQDNANT